MKLNNLKIDKPVSKEQRETIEALVTIQTDKRTPPIEFEKVFNKICESCGDKSSLFCKSCDYFSCNDCACACTQEG